jgi:hypothetical protein
MTPFPRLEGKGFDLTFTYHADAILRHDFPDAIGELDEILKNISIPVVELVRGGGGEAQVTQRLRRALQERHWTKRVVRVEKRLNDRTTFAQSHEIDHMKDFERGTIALEIEWNNKDPFFDRDLENFSRLHSDGGISVGVIVTRGRSLQDGLSARVRVFASANSISSIADLTPFGLAPTRRQSREIERYQQRNQCDFTEAWATCFIRDKFGTATTHWTKLKSRIDRGVGSPCPIVAIGIPLSCVVD